MIDDLEYFNYSGTNRINTIVDSGTPAGFDKGNAIVFAAYNYDANGNLSHDPFNNLDFAYNHLNLPDTIIQPGSNSRIVYRYDAAGNKLRKEVLNDSIILTGPFTENQYQARFITTDGQPTALDSTLLVAQNSIVFKPGFHAKPGLRLRAKIDSSLVPIDQTDYIGGVEYRNGGIRAIYHPEGRAVPSGSNWRHEYVITDHLGNTRLRFSDLDGNSQIDSTEILDEIAYYPFGQPWQDAGYRYTYNGKELDRELGLGLHFYGFRLYDPVQGRFTGVDPLAGDFAAWSPFSYTFNNPIRFIDPDGAAPKDAVQDCCGEAGAERMIRQRLASKMAERSGERVDLVYNKIMKAEGDATFYAGLAGMGIALAFIGPEVILKEVGEEVFEQATGIPVILDPIDIAEKAVKGSFKEAAGKELKTFFKNNIGETKEVITKRLRSSAKTHQKQIDKHKGWIDDPKSKYGDKWDTFSEERKANAIYHWKQDIKRHEAYRDSKNEAIDQLNNQ
jgi:RHS repeat-associated protein